MGVAARAARTARATPSTPNHPPRPPARQALAPYGLSARDLVETPLGVTATVLGVVKKTGVLWLMYPGKVKSPMPAGVSDQESMERYGYKRSPNWAHIERRMLELSLLQKAGIPIMPPMPSLDDTPAPAKPKAAGKGKLRGRSKSKSRGSKTPSKRRSKSSSKLRRSKSASKRKSRSG